MKTPPTVVLYHFTTAVHWPSISACGELRTTESNLSPHRPHAGPDVVWLTSSPDRDSIPVLRGGGRIGFTGLVTAEKRELRFTVELPRDEVFHWVGWARRRRIEKPWLQRLVAASRGSNHHSWWVIERPIVRSEWREVARWTGVVYEAMEIVTP